ncbi:accessory Sec system glycosyltransferase Asp1, partial [Staphylococcus capitis]|uniref:accessory Sec system glycosyltransferase Asp1 n=1 Tax=Staphylococcus capitis TaxID=29388 RepID=UPI0021B255D4
MITLISMHDKNRYKYNVLLLNYSPNLTFFLHTHHLFQTHYSSLFHLLQTPPNTLPTPIHYLHFNSPKDTHFVYSPFILQPLITQNTYSQLTFNQHPYLLHIHQYQNPFQQQNIIFHHTPFISSI